MFEFFNELNLIFFELFIAFKIGFVYNCDSVSFHCYSFISLVAFPRAIYVVVVVVTKREHSKFFFRIDSKWTNKILFCFENINKK